MKYISERSLPSTTSALGDHIGMVRPSYEAPTTIYVVNNLQSSVSNLAKAGQTFLNVPYSLHLTLTFIITKVTLVISGQEAGLHNTKA